MKFLSKLYKTPLIKSIELYENILLSWNKKYENDNSTEKISFEKGEITIVFEEDLREHTVNFYLLHPKKRLVKIYYRKCIYISDIFNSQKLLLSLSKLNELSNEIEQTKIYFDFLIENKIL